MTSCGCEHWCGGVGCSTFEGIASRRFCSDRCRMRASRERQSEATAEAITLQDERRATIERLFKLRDEISGGRVLADDSTEILRSEREEHSRHLADS